MANSDYATLRSNVNFLGRLLGETIAGAQGPDFLGLIEEIRLLSKRTREGSEDARTELQGVLNHLGNDQLVPVARAFSQFLNLANIADQHYNVSRESDEMLSALHSLVTGFQSLIDQGVDPTDIEVAISQLKIELVLTAHPTEITRRTLIHKHGEIGRCLAQLELQGLTQREQTRIHARLRELIAQIWFGDDFRTDRPTPVDEAKWGFAVVEDSLWRAVPNF
ncbi:MAG: phosphoenolpyruvate carboxylase, partial [Pseudomonadota bacterium]